MGDLILDDQSFYPNLLKSGHEFLIYHEKTFSVAKKFAEPKSYFYKLMSKLGLELELYRQKVKELESIVESKIVVRK